jgi:hypothetical protein
MELPQDLVTSIAAELAEREGPALVIGSRPLAAALADRCPSLAVVSLDPFSRKTRPSSREIVADLEALPVAPRALSSLCAVEVLSRFPSPDALISSWRQALRPRGSILVVERLIQSATMRALRRLLSTQRYQPPPEGLTALLLNAGFVSVGQSWPASRTRVVITRGTRASFE